MSYSIATVAKKVHGNTSTFVRIAWLAVQQEAPNVLQIHQLIQYFNETCLNGQFVIQQWNYFDYIVPRTNNHFVGWHSRLKK